MDLLLEITKDQYSSVTISGENFGEMLAFGGKMLLIGMLTVFTVLAMIWGCLALFKLFFHDLPEKRAAAAKATDTPAPAEDLEIVEEDPSELIAVLTAAVAAAEEGNANRKFRVVSFRRA